MNSTGRGPETESLPDLPKPTIPAGFVVFSTGDCPEGRAEVRAWMHEKGLTRKYVAGKIMGGQCCLVALRPLWTAP